MDTAAQFEAERPRLVRVATGLLGDPHEAQDVVQQAWLRMVGTDADIRSLPAWLTTVTTRLCLDRLRAKVPEPIDEPIEVAEAADPAGEIELADVVGVALQVVMDRLSPAERVAFVLHDTFGFDFATIATILDMDPAAARKSASRARAKVTVRMPGSASADSEVVDAFLAAARGGNFAMLLNLLAPDVVVSADAAAIATGTPARLEGRDEVAKLFNGAAKTAFPVVIDGRPGAAWYLRGEPRVAFDFTVVHGVVTEIVFRAEPTLLASLVRRGGTAR